ncbi:MAG: hypothetical protein PUC23_05220 [bacterium]|nr:hypothetical protein [bacterium]
MQKIKRKLTKFELIVYTFTIILSMLFPLFSVYSKSILSKVNYEVEEIKEETEKRTKTNEDLKMQVNELASLENLESVAKEMGLVYTYNNVKVVE